MKKFLLLIPLFFVQLLVAQRLIILHTNDMHSKMTGFGPEAAYTPMTINDDLTIGGFARTATLIKQERQKNPNDVLVLDAGDFLMGTVFQCLENQTGFQLSLMKEMGYDFITFGNHEFDMGPQFIADAVNTANKNGKIPQILASQLIFSSTSKDDDLLEKLVNDKVIKPYQVITINGLKVGIFGIIGDNAIFDAVGAKPLTFADRIKTAKNITKILREQEKVNIVICLSHSGVYPDGKGGWTFEDVDMAKKVPDIDIIISGHTHVETPQPIIVGKTIIVQTGCFVHNLGRLEINYQNGKVTVDNFKLIPVDDKIQGDAQVNSEIEDYKKVVDKEIFAKQELEYSTPIAETSFLLKESESNDVNSGNLGNFITDAVNYYTDTYSTPTDLVLLANGTIREKILVGKITPADIYRVMPLGRGTNDYFGSSLAQVYITGNEIKKIFELILFASKQGEDSYLFYSGAQVYYNPKGGFLNKVKKVLIDGKEIDISKKNTKLYTLTANLYLLGFVGQIKKLSHGLIVVTPKDINGKTIANMNNQILDFDKNISGLQEGKEWLALVKYLEHFQDTNGDGIADIPDQYKNFQQRILPEQK